MSLATIASTFAVLFVAELGDKTQLALVALAASTGETLAVFIGGTLALWLVSVLGVVVGATLLRRVPAVWVHRVAAVRDPVKWSRRGAQEPERSRARGGNRERML
ncbi:MAG: TMEM165/GDT1 family protein [Thiohalorhabdus sp.]|uniref:TMEM165/GDT1 family protein n=1 Tax=Thiohalorhabdus sp. TaxID=3094134 RepID=UPI00397FB6A7